MPKLLFVGIIERTCRATIIREIPGIRECFHAKDDSRGGQPEVKVHLLFNVDLIPTHLTVAHNQRIQLQGHVALCCWHGRKYIRG